MAQTAYAAIRTGIMNYLITRVSWLTAANCLDYSPTDAEVIFGALPLVTVDFDPRREVRWEATEEGYWLAIPFIVELYVEIEKPDASYGRDASEDISAKLNELENVFVAAPSIGGLVKTSGITNSKLELLQLRAVKLGVLARWAWLSLTVFVVK